MEVLKVHDGSIQLDFRGFEIKTMMLKLDVGKHRSSGEWLHV